MRMSDRRLGLTRLVAVAAALALILANVVGAYAHAHAHGTSTLHVDHHYEAAAAPGDGVTLSAEIAELGHMDEDNGKKSDHATSCDFVCHGGIAILSAFADVSDQPQSTEQPGASRSVDLLLAASLERPPRFSVSA